MKGLIEITTSAKLEDVLTDEGTFVKNEAVDPFQRFWNVPGTERHQPCYMPSRTRNRQMELLRKMEEAYPVEPFTQDQEDAVRLYRVLSDAEARNLPNAFSIRMKIADINARNGWTMAMVAHASHLNYWPDYRVDSISWRD